jgi:hypothetical protein
MRCGTKGGVGGVDGRGMKENWAERVGRAAKVHLKERWREGGREGGRETEGDSQGGGAGSSKLLEAREEVPADGKRRV